MNKGIRTKFDLSTIRMIFTCLVVGIIISGALALLLSMTVYKDLLPFEWAGVLVLFIHTLSSTICSVLSQKIPNQKSVVNALMTVAAYIVVIAFVGVVILGGSASYCWQCILVCFVGSICGYLIGNYRVGSRAKRRKRR